MADIIDQGGKIAGEWLKDPKNQKQTVGWLQMAYSWIKGCFSSKNVK